MKTWLLTVAIVLLAATSAQPQVVGWRGDGTATYPNAKPPQSWSKSENVIWKASLPGGGHSSPVLSQGRLFLLAEPTHALCVDATSGEIRWQATVDYAAALGPVKAAEIDAAHEKFEAEEREWKQRLDAARKDGAPADKMDELTLRISDVNQRRKEYERRYPKQRRGGAGNAAGTPLCDGERVFVTFGTGIVAAFDLAGERRWVRHVEGPELGFGHSASPVLAGGLLIVHYQDLVALDPDSGAEKWRVELPAMHGTSAVVEIGGEQVLATPSGALVLARDGRILGEGLYKLSNNSPLIHDGVIYAHESGKVKAIPIPSSLDGPLRLEPIWETASTRDQRMASAVCHDGLLFAATRGGILDVTDAVSGDVLYRKRLDLGEVFSGVTMAGGLIFVSGRDGKTLVLRPGRDYDEVAINEAERISSTPVFAGERMYLRTDKTLYCIGVK
jgi:outer membrane protein assembly factor BamB